MQCVDGAVVCGAVGRSLARQSPTPQSRSVASLKTNTAATASPSSAFTCMSGLCMQRCGVSTVATSRAVGRAVARQSRHRHRHYRLSAVCLRLRQSPVQAVVQCVDGGNEQSSRPIRRTAVSTPTPPLPPLGRLPSPPSVACAGSGAVCRRQRRRAEVSANHVSTLTCRWTRWRYQSTAVERAAVSIDGIVDRRSAAAACFGVGGGGGGGSRQQWRELQAAQQ